jgi:hypothetical protein
MIAETVIISITAITVGSLWLSNQVHRRMNSLYSQAIESTAGGSSAVDGYGLYPFDAKSTTTKHVCLLCGTKCCFDGLGGQIGGPRSPLACNGCEECKEVRHLHFKCRTCGGSFLTYTAH